MIHRTSLLGLSFAVVLTGCASTEQNERVASNAHVTTDVDVGAPQASPDKHATTDVPRTPPGPPPSADDGWVLGDADKRGEAIGQPCRAEVQDESNGVTRCGTKGHVSMEVDRFGSLNAPAAPGSSPPCVPQEIGNPDEHSPYAVRACVAGDHVLISTVCMICRVASGQSVHAKISELDDRQRKFVFSMLRVTGDPPTDAAGWKKTVASHLMARAP